MSNKLKETFEMIRLQAIERKAFLSKAKYCPILNGHFIIPECVNDCASKECGIESAVDLIQP